MARSQSKLQQLLERSETNGDHNENSLLNSEHIVAHLDPPSRDFRICSNGQDRLVATSIQSSESDNNAYVSVEVTENSNCSTTVEVSMSAVLVYCKRRILLPYFRMLSLLGWRPLLEVTNDSPLYYRIMNTSYTLAVIVFILVGYLLQFASCFRRDGYDCYRQPFMQTEAGEISSSQSSQQLLTADINIQDVDADDVIRSCEGNVIFLYIIPDILHFAAYLHALYVLRNTENEQLQNILERVFLQSSMSHAWHMSQRRVIRILRMFLLLAVIWLLMSLTVQVLHIVSEEDINFTWIKTDSDSLRVVLLGVMLIGTIWFDIICVAVITSYCVHCQLVQSYVISLCDRVRERTLSFLEFIKAIEDSRKILRYVNDYLATGMSLLLIIFACNSATGLYNVFGGNLSRDDNIYKIMSSIGSLLLWLSIFSFPIVQAVRLTSALLSLKKLGHELRSRPFGYTSTPLEELDSFLLYTTNLSLKARIFRVPVTCAFILSVLTGSVFCLIFLGQISVVKFTDSS